MYSIVFTAGDESQVLAEFATKEEARAYGDRVYRDYVDRGMLTMQQTLRKDANGVSSASSMAGAEEGEDK